LDHALRIEQKKNLKLTFEKAKSFIENLTKLLLIFIPYNYFYIFFFLRDFEKSHLGRFLTVFPKAFVCELIPNEDAKLQRRGTARHAEDLSVALLCCYLELYIG
jgi:hypothetical protein